MNTVEWLLLIAAIVYVCLVAIAFKFPRTRNDWRKERRETLQTLMSVTLFLMLFFLLWYVSASLDWPDAVLIIFWVCAFSFAGLVLVGIFAPGGVKLRFERKKEAKVQGEDE